MPDKITNIKGYLQTGNKVLPFDNGELSKEQNNQEFWHKGTIKQVPGRVIITLTGIVREPLADISESGEDSIDQEKPAVIHMPQNGIDTVAVGYINIIETNFESDGVTYKFETTTLQNIQHQAYEGEFDPKKISGYEFVKPEVQLGGIDWLKDQMKNGVMMGSVTMPKPPAVIGGTPKKNVAPPSMAPNPTFGETDRKINL